MTRRLEPRDRVRELGDASVPFLYDTHALFFSDDAVTLENELHKAFAHRRVNLVNQRREFFFATPQEVRDLLMQKFGGLLEFNETPEAPEYYQSRGSWPASSPPNPHTQRQPEPADSEKDLATTVPVCWRMKACVLRGRLRLSLKTEAGTGGGGNWLAATGGSTDRFGHRLLASAKHHRLREGARRCSSMRIHSP